MNRFSHRIIAATALLSVMTMSTACYGPFYLTKNVYHWNSNIKGNGQINDKWMKEIVFFGMLIVPAYMFSALLDTFSFNSMHFWTGESPLKASDTGRDDAKVATVGDTTIRWTQSNDGATVTYERQGVLQRRATIVSQATGYRRWMTTATSYPRRPTISMGVFNSETIPAGWSITGAKTDFTRWRNVQLHRAITETNPVSAYDRFLML